MSTCLEPCKVSFFMKFFFSYVINFYLLNRYYTMTAITTKVAAMMKTGPISATGRHNVWAIVGECIFSFAFFDTN